MTMYNTHARLVLKEPILCGVRVGTIEELMRRSGRGMSQTKLNKCRKYSPQPPTKTNSGLIYIVVTPTRIAFFNVKQGFFGPSTMKLGKLLQTFPRSSLSSMQVMPMLNGTDSVCGGDLEEFGLRQTIEFQKGRYAPVDVRFEDGTHYVLLCCCNGMKIFQKTLLELVGMKKNNNSISGSSTGYDSDHNGPTSSHSSGSLKSSGFMMIGGGSASNNKGARASVQHEVPVM